MMSSIWQNGRSIWHGLIEKAFGNLKERLNIRRTAAWSEQNLEGKLFVQFVALMYLTYIAAAMNENGLFKDYALYEVLDDLGVIDCFEQSGHAAKVGEMTKKQKVLFTSLGVAVLA